MTLPRLNPIDTLTAEGWPQHTPEGLSVLVVGADSLAQAREAAPLIAARLFPDRDFGAVLWIDKAGWNPDQWEAVVEDRGAKGAYR